MNRSDLLGEFAHAHGLSIGEARAYLDTFLGCITHALADGQRVTLDGFGVFALRYRAARTATNPATGEPMVIEAGGVPTFRSSPRLKHAVNAPRHVQ